MVTKNEPSWFDKGLAVLKVVGDASGLASIPPFLLSFGPECLKLAKEYAKAGDFKAYLLAAVSTNVGCSVVDLADTIRKLLSEGEKKAAIAGTFGGMTLGSFIYVLATLYSDPAPSLAPLGGAFITAMVGKAGAIRASMVSKEGAAEDKDAHPRTRWDHVVKGCEVADTTLIMLGAIIVAAKDSNLPASQWLFAMASAPFVGELADKVVSSFRACQEMLKGGDATSQALLGVDA